ncbi:MAG: type II toxin-antitoxin system VapC family toxin [Caulobacter sp.]|nr:type II toxin-antitoxin system VapC family toxin [Caulobacter sp.]
MIRYLLDTNIISDLVRNPLGLAAQRVALLHGANICTSIIVAAELRFGVARRGPGRVASAVEGALAQMSVLPFDEPADRAYARIRAELEAAGRPIGGFDCLIAAHALAADCTLVTANEREFARVPDLLIENWLRP